MRVRWENVFALALVAALIFLLARAGREVTALVTEAFNPAIWDPEHARVTSMMVFGLLLLLIVAIVRILVSRGK